mgnify:FL=1
MKTIILVTYDISPYRGSEASVSWNYVSNMGVHHKLIVLYGRGKEEIEKYLESHQMPNVSFVNIPYVSLQGRGLLLDIKYNLNYRRWHYQTYLKAKELVDNEHVDVIHYLNPIGFKEPGYCWKIKEVPYVWGPIQGVENRPLALFPALSPKGKINALARRLVHNGMLMCLPRVRKALKRADAVFAATPNTVKQLKRIHHKDTIYLPENGILKMECTEPITMNDTLNLIWVGSIDERKALSILITALGKVKHNNWHLNVLGDGPLKGDSEILSNNLGISDRITFHGKVDRTQVQLVFGQSQVHVISSLGEATTTVLWEAFSKAIPTITLDHCGMAGVVSSECGIKIPIRSYHQVLNDMAFAIDDLIEHPEKVTRLSQGTIECAKKFMWKNRIALYDKVYDKVLEKYER